MNDQPNVDAVWWVCSFNGSNVHVRGQHWVTARAEGARMLGAPPLSVVCGLAEGYVPPKPKGKRGQP